MILQNPSPFFAHRFVVLDKTGAETLVVMLKATFSIGENNELTPAKKQRPIQFIDEFNGEPGLSSLKLANEGLPPKPGTDVLLVGDARAPREGVRSLDVRLRVGPVTKTVRVFGNRGWRRFLWWWWCSRPETFSRIPLVWENAYGGTDTTPRNDKRHDWEPRNPVGRGFRSGGSRANWKEIAVPNLEDPDHRLRRPGMESTPAAFAPIAPHWVPRVNFAGTYDERWKKERVPLLPEDFDERFYHCAPPDLVTPKPLRGDEKVEIVGCSRQGPLAFRLPGAKFSARVHLTKRFADLEVPLESVLIDANARELVMVWKGAVRVHTEVPLIRRIEIFGGENFSIEGAEEDDDDGAEDAASRESLARDEPVSLRTD